jgi:hypothetical protein
MRLGYDLDWVRDDQGSPCVLKTGFGRHRCLLERPWSRQYDGLHVSDYTGRP